MFLDKYFYLKVQISLAKFQGRTGAGLGQISKLNPARCTLKNYMKRFMRKYNNSKLHLLTTYKQNDAQPLHLLTLLIAAIYAA